MFQTSAKQTIALATIWFALLAVDLQDANAQQRNYRGPVTRTTQSQVDYDAPPAPSRATQVQNARLRAQNEARAAANPRFVQSRNRRATRSQGVRVAQNTNNRNANGRVARQVSPVSNAPVRNTSAGDATVTNRPQNSTRIIGGPTPNAGSYLPQHLRTAGLPSGQIVGGGSPILASTQLGGSSTVGGGIPSGSVLGGSSTIGGSIPSGSVLNGPVLNGPVLSGPVTGGQVSSGFVDYGTPVDSYGGEFISNGGCATGDCGGGCDGGCGVGENYFECDPCQYSNGGCPPGTGDCWLNGFSKILSRGELVVGATAFRSPGFNLTDASGATTAINDASFGFYGGVNYGIPLCRLTCGFLSGQIGVRSVQTEFDENILTSDNRDQLFVTAGLYRRVDYGLQAGIVVDFLREEWFGSSSTAQIRGDVSWVYGASALGFRFATAQDNDFTTGTLNGNDFNNVFTESIDQYRFYHRTNIAAGGFMDLYAGWSSENHTVFGVEGDVPMGSMFALQSGFTYLLPDDDLPGLNDDAWNLYMGIAIRPRGRSFYGDYDRPLLPVADNGSFINRRTSN